MNRRQEKLYALPEFWHRAQPAGEGYFWGGGLSAGYQWVLSNRFNIEASLGIGYVHARYDKYKCTTCGQKLGKGDADYIGPTRAAISIIYMLK